MATNPIPVKKSFPNDAQTTIKCDNGVCSADLVEVAINGKVTIYSPDFTCQVKFDTTDYFRGKVKNPSTVSPGSPLELKIKDKKGTVGFGISGGPCVSVLQKKSVLSATSAGGGAVANSSNEIVIGS